MSRITREQRSRGWNIKFFVDKNAFAGIYQRDDLLTIGDVARDLDLCVVFKDTGDDEWRPMLLPRTQPNETVDNTSHVPILLDEINTQPFPDPLTGVTKYNFFFHSARRCDIPGGRPHGSGAPCCRMPQLPMRRYDARYAPINKPSNTSGRLITVPQRSAKSLKRRGSSSASLSRNPSAASSQSADDPDPSVDDAEIPIALIPVADGRAIIRSFRPSVISATSVCAISGTGKSWIDALPGTGLEAAHIVPQVHWSVYPTTNAPRLANREPSNEDQPELQMAWRRTWMASNGLPLMSHLHKCFEARLISINPRTHKIRAWVDYNVITPFHGQQAHLPDLDTDPDALQHHYDMCCLENMIAAWIPDAPAPTAYGKLPSSPHQVMSSPDAPDGAPNTRSAPAHGGQEDNTSTGYTSGTPVSGYTVNPLSPPCSSTGGFKWMCGAELIDDPKEAAALLANGWLLQEVANPDEASDSDDEERGRSRKRRRCTWTEEPDDHQDQGLQKRRYLPGVNISPDSSLVG